MQSLDPPPAPQQTVWSGQQPRQHCPDIGDRRLEEELDTVLSSEGSSEDEF